MSWLLHAPPSVRGHQSGHRGQHTKSVVILWKARIVLGRSQETVGRGELENFSMGSGVLPKGQHSWNISVTKEARVDPKVVLESSMECPSRGIFFCPKKNVKTNKHTSKRYFKLSYWLQNRQSPLKGS